MTKLTCEYVRYLFDYHKDGRLSWKNCTKKEFNGQFIENKTTDIYLRVSLNRVRYNVHSLIFLGNKGYLPKNIIHINGNTFDNRIENLIDADFLDRTDLELTGDIVRLIFKYDAGTLYWNAQRGTITYGDKVGALRKKDNYLEVGINKKLYLVHRIIFLGAYNYAPEEVDHINGNRQDNRIENLREASRCSNMQNVGIRKDSTTGIKGITWCKQRNMYQAVLKHERKTVFKEFSTDLEYLKIKLNEAREKYHGEFARHE